MPGYFFVFEGRGIFGLVTRWKNTAARPCNDFPVEPLVSRGRRCMAFFYCIDTSTLYLQLSKNCNIIGLIPIQYRH
jgi:hypothetical protein